MNIQPNSRQIPCHVEYTADKDYDDLLYGYLQSISYQDGDGSRFVLAKDVVFTKIGEALGITRQTASKRFKGLQKLLLVSKKKEGIKYTLNYLPPEYAYLLPHKTLERLVELKVSKIISLFVYLCNRLYANKREPFVFYLGSVKKFIGLANNTPGNNNGVTDRLKILENEGFIMWRTCVYRHKTKGIITEQKLFTVYYNKKEDKEAEKSPDYNKVLKKLGCVSEKPVNPHFKF